MRIDSYAYIFSGLDSEPYFASATADTSYIWAVASGSGTGAAKTLIHGLEELDLGDTHPDDTAVEKVFAQFHPAVQRLKIAVSAAGFYYNGTYFKVFNTGNARAFVFNNGYLTAHTDDQSDAYRLFKSRRSDSPALYDQIRSMPGRLQLTQALGIGKGGKPVFYGPITPGTNISILLCTEQFWRYLSTIEMELDFHKSADAEDWMRYMIRRVMMKSNQELDHDNFAAAAFRLVD